MKKFFGVLFLGIFLGGVSVIAVGYGVFSDVSRDDWYGNSVYVLRDYGIVSGYGDGTFKPNQPITRGEMSAMTVRLMSLMADNGYYLKPVYHDKDDHFSFKLNYCDFDYGCNFFVKREGNVIKFFDGVGNIFDFAEVFKRDHDKETVKDKVFDIIKSEGKNVDDCVVNKLDYKEGNNDVYRIDLSEANKDIVYTDEELKRIKEADEHSDGVMDGGIVKEQIYNDRLVNLCSKYADRQGPSFSSGFAGGFIANDDSDVMLYVRPFYGDLGYFDLGSIHFRFY